MILTKREIDYIRNNKGENELSLRVDFGQRVVKAKVREGKAFFSNGLVLALEEKIRDNFSYLLDNQGLRKVIFYSAQRASSYKLAPTEDWPTITINSVPMHNRTSPRFDTKEKVNLLKPYGIVLDTCMGLGYTALLCAKKAEKVITFERDENVFYLASINPLSRELFHCAHRKEVSKISLNPREKLGPKKNISLYREDISQSIKNLQNSYFDCILHDPPTFPLAPELYSHAFYQELYRVLKENGRLFHYTPWYKVKKGYDFPSKIKSYLKRSKFKIISFTPKRGLLCQK